MPSQQPNDTSRFLFILHKSFASYLRFLWGETTLSCYTNFWKLCFGKADLSWYKKKTSFGEKSRMIWVFQCCVIVSVVGVFLVLQAVKHLSTLQKRRGFNSWTKDRKVSPREGFNSWALHTESFPPKQEQNRARKVPIRKTGGRQKR